MIKTLVKICGLIIVGLFLNSCRESQSDRPEFISTKFINDTIDLNLRQLINISPKGNFIAIFYKESSMSFGSGNKVMKLYSRDSLSIDECFYGAHPLAVTDWNDSTLIIKCSVSSGHGDKTYRKWYLDNSVDKNTMIGDLNIIYMKNY
jgi:hypothetical protein